MVLLTAPVRLGSRRSWVAKTMPESRRSVGANVQRDQRIRRVQRAISKFACGLTAHSWCDWWHLRYRGDDGEMHVISTARYCKRCGRAQFR